MRSVLDAAVENSGQLEPIILERDDKPGIGSIQNSYITYQGKCLLPIYKSRLPIR